MDEREQLLKLASLCDEAAIRIMEGIDAGVFTQASVADIEYQIRDLCKSLNIHGYPFKTRISGRPGQRRVDIFYYDPDCGKVTHRGRTDLAVVPSEDSGVRGMFELKLLGQNTPGWKSVAVTLRAWSRLLNSEATGLKVSTSEKPAAVKTTQQKVSVNDRMLLAIRSDPAAKGWSAGEWAEHLKCAKSTVASTDTWRMLNEFRLEVKAAKRNDRHGRYVRRPNETDI